MQKTNKPSRIVRLEAAVARLRHAYMNLHRDCRVGTWDVGHRRRFANGLIAPQIKRLQAVIKELMETHHGR